MAHFHYQDNKLCGESQPLALLAHRFGSPLYVYSAGAIRENYRRLAAAFAPLTPLICYAVKANFNLSILKLLKDEGAGFDIVSGGELGRVLTIGADPAHVVFAGVGKTEAELAAALEAGIGWFNVESADELERLNALAVKNDQRAHVALRLNPNVAPETHHHIQTGGAGSKFGIPVEEAAALAQRLAAGGYPQLDLRGVHVHIGSQVADPGPTLRALDMALGFIAHAPTIDTLDLGGGFPVPYRETDSYPAIEDFAAPIVAKLKPYTGRLSFHLEPGRYLVANAGALVTTVQAVKYMRGQRVIVVDTGMHHLLRPALYEAYHRVRPLTASLRLEAACDIVGPICESTDVLARDRRLPALRPGDQLAFMDAGAYGFSMASNYNAQPRPAEVLVDGSDVRLIRRRETGEDLTALEMDYVKRAKGPYG
jgi:diaminopimelate decarboxylase